MGLRSADQLPDSIHQTDTYTAAHNLYSVDCKLCANACVPVHMWDSYHLWSNSGIDHCYDNVALVVGGRQWCVCVCSRVCVCVHGDDSKGFCQMAGCCCKWEALFWRPAKVLHFIKDKILQCLIQVFNLLKLSYKD